MQMGAGVQRWRVRDAEVEGAEEQVSACLPWLEVLNGDRQGPSPLASE